MTKKGKGSSWKINSQIEEEKGQKKKQTWGLRQGNVSGGERHFGIEKKRERRAMKLSKEVLCN